MVFAKTPSQDASVKSPEKLIHNLKQKYPKRHQHYSFEDFFQFHAHSGQISDWNDSRITLASEDFIVGLIEGLESEVGSASSIVMYNIGKAWGNRDFKFFENWFEKEYEYSIHESNPAYVLEAWWWPFIAQGWGNWEVDMSDQKNGFMFVNIFDSAVARTLGNVGKPVCHIYAGLFAGFFTSLVKKELSCIEIQCYAMGETYCKFLLGKRDRIDAATFWHNEGATARDIEKRLVNGEYLQ
ncbi:4-vinyl reductase [Synechococcales cyanobacterium C]|uniref:4-vinyl reductase n=1 Tax=Petrachloros mirabilis ULC683 TaxID=2781853 RepID=A0A8K2A138_9CYAN|nr:V4R domain-containing protein [Petrachloros mirabilis]NCJ07676.1 4-vinyl reductase [Petrachloros mirabilis ULC683]